MPKLKDSKATFWVIFKQCVSIFASITNTVHFLENLVKLINEVRKISSLPHIVICMAKAFSIWKERSFCRPSNEPTLELHSSLTHALNFNGEWKGGAWTRAVQTNETLNYFYHTYPWKNRNLSSTVSVLLFQVIYSWNNHQQNEANLLHFPFFFGVCQGLSHLELKGKTLLRMGQAQFGSAAFSAMLCFFGKRWIAGLMAVKISLYTQKEEG